MTAPTGPSVVTPAQPPAGGWTAVKRVAILLWRAWTTPQRICGCKRTRW